MFSDSVFCLIFLWEPWVTWHQRSQNIFHIYTLILTHMCCEMLHCRAQLSLKRAEVDGNSSIQLRKLPEFEKLNFRWYGSIKIRLRTSHWNYCPQKIFSHHWITSPRFWFCPWEVVWSTGWPAADPAAYGTCSTAQPTNEPHWCRQVSPEGYNSTCHLTAVDAGEQNTITTTIDPFLIIINRTYNMSTKDIAWRPHPCKMRPQVQNKRLALRL